jgi:hypothetical protein
MSADLWGKGRPSPCISLHPPCDKAYRSYDWYMADLAIKKSFVANWHQSCSIFFRTFPMPVPRDCFWERGYRPNYWNETMNPKEEYRHDLVKVAYRMLGY